MFKKDSCSSVKRLLILISIGTGLEYYDFIIYATLSPYMSVLFFPNDSFFMQTIKTFSIIVVAYIVRPFGGIFLGIVADILGRKNVFLLSAACMSFSTLLIGLLPTYQVLGEGASVLLVLCRILQGISFGAELPGAITITKEIGRNGNLRFNCSIIILSTSLGSFLAYGVSYVLTSYFDEKTILSFGWRFPFLFGGMLAFVSYLIRNQLKKIINLDENFKKGMFIKRITDIPSLFLSQKRNIFLLIGMLGIFSTLVVFNLSFPIYLPKIYSYDINEIYLSTMFALVISPTILIVLNHFVLYFSSKKVLIFISILFALSNYFMFLLLSTGSKNKLFFFMIIYQIITFIYASNIFFILSEIFPTSIRYTAIAFCYNVSYLLSSLCSVFLFSITSLANITTMISCVLSVLSIISCFCCSKILDPVND